VIRRAHPVRIPACQVVRVAQGQTLCQAAVAAGIDFDKAAQLVNFAPES